MIEEKRYHDLLYLKIDGFVHNIYKVAKFFPAEERYGLTSQLRRSAVSIMLNYLEGYARENIKVYRNFLLISYGSLKETRYLINFSYTEKLMNQSLYLRLDKDADEIGACIWTTLKGLETKIKNNSTNNLMS